MREIPGKKYRIFKAALLLGLAGCGFQTDQREKLQDLDYVITEEKELPGELREILEEKKVESFRLTYEDGGWLYLCVGYGGQESGGYSISVNQLYLSENAIYFDTSLIGPKAPEAVGGESFPWLAVRTAYVDKPVVFQ
ncbi:MULTISPECIES: protease complex subunit PrcB family protein [Lachnospiraceae]|uniref:protease complex subunit PrcB family protein n=1 Tax=Lachnospiraceae TaxID=186803 RepID=UPI002ED1FC7B